MKAIIVIDMPKVCGECRASFYGDVWYCYAGEYRRPLFTENIQEKPSWCPLRPLPQKADKGMEVDISGGDDYESGYIHGWHRGVDKGWNDCLDEILGETE